MMICLNDTPLCTVTDLPFASMFKFPISIHFRRCVERSTSELSVDFVLRLSPLVVLYFSKSLLAVYWSTQMGLSLNIGWFNLSMLVKFCVLNKAVLTTDHSCAAHVSARAFYEAIPVLDFVLMNFRLDLRRPLPDQDRIKGTSPVDDAFQLFLDSLRQSSIFGGWTYPSLKYLFFFLSGLTRLECKTEKRKRVFATLKVLGTVLEQLSDKIPDEIRQWKHWEDSIAKNNYETDRGLGTGFWI